MKSSFEKLTASPTPARAIDQVTVNEGLMDLAGRVKAQGKKATPAQVVEALRLVGEYEKTLVEADPREKYRKHIEAIEPLLFGENKPFVSIPFHVDEMTDAWFEKMYPIEQDPKSKVTNFRPRYFFDPAEEICQSFPGETWFSVFARSIRTQARQMNNCELVLTETIGKPLIKKSGVLQHYGLNDPDHDHQGSSNADVLVPFIKDCTNFRATHRSMLSRETIDNRLLRMLKSKIRKAWLENLLEVPKFDVICTPAIIQRQIMGENLEMTKSSFWETTSTDLLDKDGNKTERCLVVGTPNGGAGNIDTMDKGTSGAGFRISVIFYKN